VREQIDLPEVLDTAAGTLRGSIYKCMPGIVQTYYPSTQQADIQPAVNDVRIDPILGTRISEPWPVIPKVRILFPVFGAFILYADLVPGNKVVLLGFDLDPSAFMRSGQASDPVDTRRHGGSYWVAIPGDITDGGAQAPTGSLLVLGANGDFAALATKVDAIMTLLKTFAGFFGTSAIVAPSTGIAIPTLQTAASNLAGGISSVASSRLKIPT